MKNQVTDNASNLTGMFVCAALGAAVGAGIALLYAPRSGRETREMLARKAEDIRDKTRNVVEQGKQAIARAKGEEPAHATYAGMSTSRTLS